MRKLLLPAVCCVFPVLSVHALNDGPRKGAAAAVIASAEDVRRQAPTKVVPERFGRLVAADAVAQPPAKRRQGSSDPAPSPESAVVERCEGAMDDASLRELVRREAANVGVDEKLALTLLSLESNNGADLNSGKGARGPMQLMPDTATQYGVGDICNPAENVHGAMLFLRDLSAQFGDNLMLIAAGARARLPIARRTRDCGNSALRREGYQQILRPGRGCDAASRDYSQAIQVQRAIRARSVAKARS